MSVPHLTRFLALETPVRQPDNAGGYVETWTVLGNLWGDATLRTGRERDESGAPVSTVGWKIVVRSAPVGAPSRPKPGQRLREGARVFVIQAVAERDPFGRYLTCFVEEEVAT